MKTDKLFQTMATGFLLSMTLLTLALTANAQSAPYAWGWGFYAQMGNNTSDQPAYFNPLPVAVNTSGVLAGKTVKAMAAGGFHSLALTSDGIVAAWGAGHNGQIGNGQVGNNFTPPTVVPVAVTTTGVLLNKTVTAIAAGYQFSLALCSDGSMAAWGNNAVGQLGDNSTTQRDAPVAVTTAGTPLAGKTVVAIAAGDLHCLALCSDGTVVAWGNNGNGALGDNSTANSSLPVAVNTTSGISALFGKTVTAIAAGNGASVALCSDGTVVTWGINSSGALGNNSFADSHVPVAVNTTSGISALFGKTVTAIAAGQGHVLALCSDGTVAAWGYNVYGQVGNNSTGNVPKPVAVTMAGTPLAGKTVVSIAAGHGYSMGRCSDGTMAAWGWAFHGELGDNDNTQQLSSKRLVPVAVITSQYFTGVFGGSSAHHTLGLLDPCAPPVMNIAQYAGVTVLGTIGCTYRIDYTTSLTPPITWTPLTTVTLTASSYLYIDTTLPSGTRFYQTVLLP